MRFPMTSASRGRANNVRLLMAGFVLGACGSGTSVAPTAQHGMVLSSSAQLVSDAMLMAIWRRRPTAELLHHSDRGSQYSSDQFQQLLAEHGVICSMSRSGNCWDNAAMESFFSTMKTERTSRKVYQTRDQARADVFDYIERFYNQRRRHSTLDYLSPLEYEQQRRSG